MSKRVRFTKNISLSDIHAKVEYIDHDNPPCPSIECECIITETSRHHCHKPLEMAKTCRKVMDENITNLEYTIQIYNRSRYPIHKIRYQDILTYDEEHVVLGDIIVSPSTIEVDTSVDNKVIFRDKFHCLEPRESITINYTVPLLAFRESGNYLFSNHARAKSQCYKAKANCDITVQITDSCQGIPVTNRECITKSNFSIIQPNCQFTPDNQSVSNPFFCSDTNRSYWTFELLVNCISDSLHYLDTLLIPIPATLANSVLRVLQRLLPVEQTRDVPFTIVTIPSSTTKQKKTKHSNQFPGTYISIPVNKDFTIGVGVVYQLELLSSYPETTGTLKLMLINGDIIDFVGNYFVPSEPTEPRISITKETRLFAMDNTSFMDFRVTITNTGNTSLSDIIYMDTINYNTDAVIGNITVIPPSVTVDTSLPGIIKLSDVIELLEPGEIKSILYQVPATFNSPNVYNFVSYASAMSSEARQGISSEVSIDVVQLFTSNLCAVTGKNADFNITITNAPNSPTTSAIPIDKIIVPADIIVQFNSFDICDATFEDGRPVPIDTDISDATIIVSCPTDIPPNASIHFTISLTVQSIKNSACSPIIITSTLENVFISTTNQIYLGATPLPNEAKLISSIDMTCKNRCVIDMS